MGAPSQEENDKIVADILQMLRSTRYACSTLTRLTNGTTNFVFRGRLVVPLVLPANGTTVNTVIVKHSKEFVALNKDFVLDDSRCRYEEHMLDALSKTNSLPASVKSPMLHLFNRETNIQVLEDFEGSTDLKSILVQPNEGRIITAATAFAIGRELGSWTRSFHSWAAAPSQTGLRRVIAENESMRKLKFRITYGSFIKVLEDFPQVLEGYRGILEEVQNFAIKEFEKPPVDSEQNQLWGLINGDFWTGNVLVPNDLALEQDAHDSPRLFIVDWEFAQYGHRAYDLGQMIGDIYERAHYEGVPGALPAMEGFIEGYGFTVRDDDDDGGGVREGRGGRGRLQELDDELAFRTAIHAGVHLICWYTRRAPTAPLRFPRPRVAQAMEIGRDWILKAWQQDKVWLRNSPLRSLFRD
ncbi:kinase-like domain-containing protein [Xylariales sp. PMI_506]|nr:kinase-like domain-containing protein [Xylariales sp. PMI_506]